MCRPSQVVEVAAHCMPGDYRIQPYDVLNGRGKMAFNNVGNRRFRVTLALSLRKYQTAPSRQDKTKLILSIIQLVRSNGGHFLTRSKGKWVEIGDRAAREKVGHAFRDMVGAHVARRKKQRTTARPSSPSCVAQDPNGEDIGEDPLDVFYSGVILDEYFFDVCDDSFDTDEQVVCVVDV